MIYQVRANLFFHSKADADELVESIVSAMNDAIVVHPDEPNQEGCSVELIKCYHDETPTKPCEEVGIVHSP